MKSCVHHTFTYVFTRSCKSTAPSRFPPVRHPTSSAFEDNERSITPDVTHDTTPNITFFEQQGEQTGTATNKCLVHHSPSQIVERPQTRSNCNFQHQCSIDKGLGMLKLARPKHHPHFKWIDALNNLRKPEGDIREGKIKTELITKVGLWSVALGVEFGSYS